MGSRAVPAALRLLLVSLLLVVVAPPQASVAVVVKPKSPSPKPKPKPKPPPPKAKSPPPKPKSPPPKSPAKPPVSPPLPSSPPPSPRPQPGTACSPSSVFGGATVTMSRCVNMPQGGTFSFAMPTLTSLSVIARAPPALPYGWVAFGVSPTCGMVGSHVFIAYANSEDSSKVAVGAYSLVSKVPGSAIAPLNSASAGFSLTSTPAVEATADGTGYAVRFDIQFDLFKILNYVNNGVVCIVTARGPALTAAQFAQQPVPGFQMHDWAKAVRLNVLDGTITY